MTRKIALCVVCAGMALQPAFAEEKAATSINTSLIEAIKDTKPLIDVRYRYEWKEQAGFATSAHANTLRTRLGFETGEFYHFKVLVELENVFSIGSDNFNSTTNGLTMFPVIADPDATELNRAQITFTGLEKTPITVGRQRFNLNNHRFVGAVDWRQNQQTFDAARLSTKIIDNLTVDYLYIDRVQRVFGDAHPLGDIDSDSHVISAAYNAGEFGVVKGYGVLLDLHELPGASSATWGARYENSITLDEDAGIKFGVVAEFATQADYAANPFDYRESYLHGEASLGVSSANLKLGYEKLNGDGVIGFSTPLATLHKFQGFADAFLTTPAAGIEDIYATLGYSWKDAPFGAGVKAFVTYHSYDSDVGSLDFGDEIDAGLSISFRKHWSVNLKGAVFNGGAFGPADRSLIWTSLRFQY